MPPSLFVLGDSISCYYGKYLQRDLAGIAAYDRKGHTHQLARIDDGTDGVNGGDSRMVLKYLTERQRRSGIPADWLLLNCGLHDAKRTAQPDSFQVPLPEYESNLRAALALARAMNLRCLWARTTPVNPRLPDLPAALATIRSDADVQRFNAVADRVMSDADVPVIDLYTFTKNLGDDIYLNGTDNVHFNETAAAQQAAYLAGQLARLLSLKENPKENPQ